MPSTGVLPLDISTSSGLAWSYRAEVLNVRIAMGLASPESSDTWVELNRASSSSDSATSSSKGSSLGLGADSLLGDKPGLIFIAIPSVGSTCKFLSLAAAATKYFLPRLKGDA